MKASFNYTDRFRLGYDMFSLSIHETDANGYEVQLAFKKDLVKARPKDTIILEAYRVAKTERIEMGYWEDYRGDQRYALKSFSKGEPVLFRLYIVDKFDPQHKIRAWCQKIRAVAYDDEDRKKKSVLEVEPKDLGDIVWKIAWDDEMTPVLQVNSRISDAKEITEIVAKDPDFAALVFPEVLRDVVSRILAYINENDDREDEQYKHDWMILSSRLAGEWFEFEENENEEDFLRRRDAWVERVANNFGREFDLIIRYK